MRQKDHGYRINWKKSILNIGSLWLFSRGGSQLLSDHEILIKNKSESGSLLNTYNVEMVITSLSIFN